MPLRVILFLNILDYLKKQQIWHICMNIWLCHRMKMALGLGIMRHRKIEIKKQQKSSIKQM